MAKVFSAFLAFAVSGILCLCCFQAAKSAQQTEHCPLDQASNHCKFAKKESSETSAKVKLNSNHSGCCELKLNIFVATLEKNSFSQPIPATTQNPSKFFDFERHETRQKSVRFVYRPPIFDYGNLHVTNCVFRI